MELHNLRDSRAFADQVGNELKRAERYSIFVTLSVFDFGFLAQTSSQPAPALESIRNVIAASVRATDSVSLIGDAEVGVLFPETTRQGAEIATRRAVELVRTKILADYNGHRSAVIAAELASYPDAAGVRSVEAMLKEINSKIGS